MNPSALAMMIGTYTIVISVTLYYFFKVLRKSK